MHEINKYKNIISEAHGARLIYATLRILDVNKFVSCTCKRYSRSCIYCVYCVYCRPIGESVSGVLECECNCCEYLGTRKLIRSLRADDVLDAVLTRLVLCDGVKKNNTELKYIRFFDTIISRFVYVRTHIAEHIAANTITHILIMRQLSHHQSSRQTSCKCARSIYNNKIAISSNIMKKQNHLLLRQKEKKFRETRFKM